MSRDDVELRARAMHANAFVSRYAGKFAWENLNEKVRQRYRRYAREEMIREARQAAEGRP
jgi:acetyl-CoA acetyltransferase